MGMYSYITKQDLRIRKGYLHKLRQTIEKHRHSDGWRYYESVDICANGRVKLDDLNGCKIIGYWDRQFCRFLKDVGQYIRGVIALEYENEEESPATIHFCEEDGKPTVTIEMPRTGERLSPDDLM